MSHILYMCNLVIVVNGRKRMISFISHTIMRLCSRTACCHYSYRNVSNGTICRAKYHVSLEFQSASGLRANPVHSRNSITSAGYRTWIHVHVKAIGVRVNIDLSLGYGLRSVSVHVFPLASGPTFRRLSNPLPLSLLRATTLRILLFNLSGKQLILSIYMQIRSTQTHTRRIVFWYEKTYNKMFYPK